MSTKQVRQSTRAKRHTSLPEYNQEDSFSQKSDQEPTTLTRQAGAKRQS